MLLTIYGVNPALHAYPSVPAFWFKMAFAAALVVPGLFVTARLARPGVLVGSGKCRLWRLSLSCLVMWRLAVVALIGAEPATRAHLIMGNTWYSCPFNIALMALPAFVASLLALKQSAPTRLRAAGAAAGLAAGALVCALYCPELAAPFLAI